MWWYIRFLVGFIASIIGGILGLLYIFEDPIWGMIYVVLGIIGVIICGHCLRR